jgi:cytochrome b6-f complex iron-sulfur subunit
MLPPREGGGEGTAAPAVEAEPEPEVQPVQAEVVAETTSVATTEAAPVASNAAAQRIAAAKARAAAKGSPNGGTAAAAPATAAPAAVPAARPAVPAARPAAAPEPAAEPAEEVGQPGINRREFLTYAWGAALGLLTLETGVATYAFMYPRFRAGEFGGKFDIGAAASLPTPEAAPVGNTNGKFWLVDTESGPKALYMVCTHLGCLYKWEPSNFRFECPCHGSKFSHDGYYIEGPAPRSLDQFVIEIVQNGTVVSQTSDEGEEILPPQVPGPDAQIVIDTGSRIVGKPAAASPARAES